MIEIFIDKSLRELIQKKELIESQIVNFQKEITTDATEAFMIMIFTLRRPTCISDQM